MKEQNQLIKTDSIWYKIKNFLKKIIYKSNSNIPEVENYIERNKENSFKENIKKIEDEEIKLLKLQKQFRNGEIQERDLTEEQINDLCNLYHRQISNLRKSNEIRKQKILEYRKNLKFN